MRWSVGSEARTLLFCAHPDDETIGAASVMLRGPDVFVVYLTDGAPRERRFWPGEQRSRSAYARTRRREAAAALQIAGISPERVFCLGVPDQEAILQAGAITANFAELVQLICPAVVVTHPYEGGHPDHDAAALVAALVRALRPSRLRPELMEMTSYHADQGELRTGEFLPGHSVREQVVQLTRSEVEQKTKMFAAHESQREVLRDFGVREERFRRAPRYVFSNAPHSGQLWYERLGMAMTGAIWRNWARKAIAEMEQRCV
ncbi:MAG: PIG-L family deacetylase [Acidobacteria bacterium]|nr:MAG: PIG-L family deacetylase [Acidobacteriota bacterium]